MILAKIEKKPRCLFSVIYCAFRNFVVVVVVMELILPLTCINSGMLKIKYLKESNCTCKTNLEQSGLSSLLWHFVFRISSLTSAE